MDIKKRKLIILGSIVLIAVLLRLFYSFVIYPQIADRYNWYLDDGYDELAWNLVQGNGYVFQPGKQPTAERPPGYPLFLTVIFFIFGREIWVVQVIQSLLGGLTSLLLYFLGKKTFNERVGIITAFFFAIYLHSILYTARFFTEPLYIFLMVVFMLYLVRLFEGHDFKISFMVGILLAILTLIRASTLFLPLFILLFLLLNLGHKKRLALKNFCIMLIGMTILIAPWTFRNYIVSKHFIPIASIGGLAFYAGNLAVKDVDNRWVTAANGLIDIQLNLEGRRIAKENNIENEAERDKFLYRITLNWISEHPLFFVKNWAKKFFYFWYLAPSSKLGTLVSLMIHLFFLILGGIGFVLAKKDRVNVLPFIVVILYFNLLHTFYGAQARYSVPIMPFIMIFASYTLLTSKYLSALIKRIVPHKTEYRALGE